MGLETDVEQSPASQHVKPGTGHWGKLAVDRPFCYTQTAFLYMNLAFFLFLYKAERNTSAHLLCLFSLSPFFFFLIKEKHLPSIFAKLFSRRV